MDELRGFAVALVVLFHADSVLGRFVPQSEALQDLMNAGAPFRMPLLMFLSGMLFGRSLSKPTGRYAGGKIRAIAWPYLLWSLIAVLVTQDGLSVDKAWRIAVLPPTYLSYLWFLLAYYIGGWVIDRLRLPWPVFIGVAFVLSFGPETYRFSRFFFLFVFFSAGHLLATRARRQAAAAVSWPLVAASTALVTACAVLSYSGVDMQYEPLWIVAPAAGVVLALFIAPRLPRGRPARLLGYIGHDSIVFYVTHFVVAWITCELLADLGVDNALPMFMAAAAVAMAGGLSLVALPPTSTGVLWLAVPVAGSAEGTGLALSGHNGPLRTKCFAAAGLGWAPHCRDRRPA